MGYGDDMGLYERFNTNGGLSMEITWRTIEKDGIPPVGTFCLCKLEGGYSSCGYMILLVSSVAGNRLFTLYDLLVPQGKIIKYIPISELDKEE